MRMALVRAIPLALRLGFLFVAIVVFSSPLASADKFVLTNHPSKLLLPPGELIEDSAGGKSRAAAVACNRVHFHGVSRFWNLDKYANAVKLTAALVVPGDATSRVPSFEVCFHGNGSIGVGVCPEGRWEKVTKGRWVRSVSPFDYGILDFRMSHGQSLRFMIEVTTEEERLLHRVFFLVSGIAMMVSAHWMSECLAVYYGSSMFLAIVMVVLVILFQATRLLPFGRKSSLAMLMYSSAVGVVGFILHYLFEVGRSFLVEFGIGEDMQKTLGVLLIICLFLAGAWFGFWTVRKFILSEDGSSIDPTIAEFVKWAIRIFSAAMTVQSSLDILLALEAVGAAILLTVITVRAKDLLFFIRFCSRVVRSTKRSKLCQPISPGSPVQKNMIEESTSPNKNMSEEAQPLNALQTDPPPVAAGPSVEDSVMIEEAQPLNAPQTDPSSPVAARPSVEDPIMIEEAQTNDARQTDPSSSVAADSSLEDGSAMTPVHKSVEEEMYLSTFHNIPNRKAISKEEWEAIAAETTENAMKELCSSPDFTRWAIANADRIVVTPER